MTLLRPFLRKIAHYFNIYKINHVSYAKIEHVFHRFNGNNKCFFLKINNELDMSFLCIQKWLDVISILNRDYVFICDNKNLKEKVLSYMKFPDWKKVCFVRSKRLSLMKYSKKITQGNNKFAKMTCAHLTPFWLMNKNAKYSWHIDADDTYFVLNTNKLVKVINGVENLFVEQKYDALSLDMWVSQTTSEVGDHFPWWTLGVAIMKNSPEIISLLENQDDGFMKNISFKNLDIYFAYLSGANKIKAGSFYVENCYFIHCGMNIARPKFRPLQIWKDGFLHYPIVNTLFNNSVKSSFEIPSNVLKIDIGLTNECNEKTMIDAFIK